MGVFSYEAEVTSVIPRARLFKAFLHGHDIKPKAAPHIVKSAHSIHSHGGPITAGHGGPVTAGTFKKVNYAQGRGFKDAKHRIDEIDHDNFKYSYTVIEGGTLVDKLEKISTEFKIEAAPGGGSLLKITSTYYTKDNSSMNQEELNAAKEIAVGDVKVIEAYLLAHPDVCSV